jgi:hypothetical protein
MPVWAVVAIVAGAFVVAAAMLWTFARRRRTASLQERFGREYDRAVDERGTRREAEDELSRRVQRRERLRIRPLGRAEREAYLETWRKVQARFVDHPEAAIAEAHSLVCRVMADRGYPVDDFEQRLADLSVDHAEVLGHYRAAQAIATSSERGEATTEELRQAMQHYRELFAELLETDRDEPLSRNGTAETATERVGA